MAEFERIEIKGDDGTFAVSAKNGTVFLWSADQDGDCESLQAMSSAAAIKLANAILSAAIWLRS